VRERAGESGESEELQRRRRRAVLVFWRGFFFTEKKWTPAGARMLSKSKSLPDATRRWEDACAVGEKMTAIWIEKKNAAYSWIEAGRIQAYRHRKHAASPKPLQIYSNNNFLIF
jgi:hypothetical protein